MKYKRWTAIVMAALATVAAVAAVAAGCGSSGGSSSSPSPSASASTAAETVDVQATTQAQTLNVDVGDAISVKLPGNPSTGYHWVFVPDSDGVLAAAGQQSFKAQSSALGAPGLVTIPLKAAKAGSAIAVFKEMPPGSGSKTPGHVWAFVVNAYNKARPAQVSINQTYVAETAVMNQGDTLRVYLPSQSGSTGYSWQLASVSGSELKPTGHAASGGSMPGSPGQTVFSFNAAAAGTATMLFQLVAPDRSVAGTYAMSAQVKAVAKPVDVKVDWLVARSGQVTQVMQGDTLQVSLDGRPSDGYGWNMQIDPSSALKQVGQPVFHPNGDQIGAGGQLVYTYKVKGGGAIDLKAAYHNLSNAGEPPTRLYTFKFQSATKPEPAVVNATGGNATPVVALDRGDTLKVNVDGNAGTDYTWSVGGMNTGVLQMVGEPVFKASGTQAGAAGTVTFAFKAVGVGTTTPIMLHSAPGTGPAQTFAFQATVGAGQHTRTYTMQPSQVATPIVLTTGQSLRVALEGNPTTGYSWVDATPDNIVLAESAKPVYTADEDLPGANGTFYLTWGAAGPGGELVTASYQKAGTLAAAATWADWVTVEK